MFGEAVLRTMKTSVANLIIRIGCPLLGVGFGLFSALCALAALFDAIGGPDGKFGSRESIEWAVGFALASVISAILSWWFFRKTIDQTRA